ncbi:helix-turn-helix domain-containing protein [Corynebacterium senegalense]|uniref:helix-turn-helix domain-containing protein n=1 Tax=Corynebacterium senegalense TaxID=2080750 RepID=UPI000E206FEC|nr:helix-turn-helix transcriptional regulator [Corynebacterium senegalense]
MTKAIHMAGFVPQFDLCDRVRKAREVAGLTQDELGEKAGVGRATVARIERGKGTPRRASLIAIAFATGVDFNWLETGETPAGEPDGGSAVRHQGLEPRTH